MSSSILTVNAGSSSIKFAVYAGSRDELKRVGHGEVSGLASGEGRLFWREYGEERNVGHAVPVTADHVSAVRSVLETLRSSNVVNDHPIIAVGHRVVHGGTQYFAPTRVNAQVMDALEQMVPLAPLHQPHSLSALRALSREFPSVPHVACFDTAFHRDQPEVAQMFALPKHITEAGVRRYGFHGLSYEYIAGAMSKYDIEAATGRTIVLHLGNGASMCAMINGKSVASTMGFTALDGLPMATRCGALDPGVILYMMQSLHMELKDVQRVLYSESGLLGVSGVSGDMKVLEQSNAREAKLAVELFVYRIAREAGSLIAAMQGLDAIVFTGGIGENSILVRQRVCESLKWLGLELDSDANAAKRTRISESGSVVSALVIPTDEELMIARHTSALLIA